MLNENPLDDYNNRFTRVEGSLRYSPINDYDNFAAVYDNMMGRDIADVLFAKYDGLIRNSVRDGACLVDLACGSGAFLCLAAVSIGRGLRYYGVDMSSEQLKVAKRNAYQKMVSIELLQGDVTSFHLPEDCRVVTMNLDAINHLRAPWMWERVFDNVYSGLEEGGVFLFDMNIQKRLIEDWDHTEIIKKRRKTYVQLGSGVERSREGWVTRRLYMEVFSGKSPDIRRYIVNVEQTAPTQEILFGMLREVGFSRIDETKWNPEERDQHIFLKNRLFVQAYK